jgi:hypothetical protein
MWQLHVALDGNSIARITFVRGRSTKDWCATRDLARVVTRQHHLYRVPRPTTDTSATEHEKVIRGPTNQYTTGGRGSESTLLTYRHCLVSTHDSRITATLARRPRSGEKRVPHGNDKIWCVHSGSAAQGVSAPGPALSSTQ